MVWRMKLPEEPHRAYSAYEVARRLGVKVEVVRAVLVELGEFVDSNRKKLIEEPTFRRVCEALQVDYGESPTHRPSPWVVRDSVSPAVAVAGVIGSPYQVGPRPDGPYSTSSRDQSLGLGDRSEDASDAMADASWVFYGFSEVERDAWRVYLRSGQAKDAAILRAAGFAPDDLMVEVSGWTVAKRLRAGESPSEVMRLLKRSRAQPKSS